MKKARCVGLDVHADTIAVAVAESDGEVRSMGVIPNRAESIRKVVKKLGPATQLRVCYKAGPAARSRPRQAAFLAFARCPRTERQVLARITQELERTRAARFAAGRRHPAAAGLRQAATRTGGPPVTATLAVDRPLVRAVSLLGRSALTAPAHLV